MIPTVATSLKSRETGMAWKECISPDWNMMNYYTSVGVGMKVDDRVLGRQNNRGKPQHDLTPEHVTVGG